MPFLLSFEDHSKGNAKLCFPLAVVSTGKQICKCSLIFFFNWTDADFEAGEK